MHFILMTSWSSGVTDLHTVHFVQILIEIFVTLFFEVSRFYFNVVAAMGALEGGVRVNFQL